jgi:poly(A) polymerase
MVKTAGALEIVKRLRGAGFTAYYAGGWVRDFLLGHPSEDVDIATDAPPEQILALFSKTLLVGLSFAVVIVEEYGHLYEVASFRKDIAYSDGRKPDHIELSTAEEDAKRRDFTINGMFFDPLEEKIYDYVGGREDLHKKIVRAIGNPYTRFSEDRLRMLRAIRFSARFDFMIDDDTEEAILANADTILPACAKERIYQEFCKMATFERFDRALLDMHRLGLLEGIYPLYRDLHHNDLKKALIPYSRLDRSFPMIVFLRLTFRHWPLEDQVAFCEFLRTSEKDIAIVKYLDMAERKLHTREAMTPAEYAHLFSSPYAHFLFSLDPNGTTLHEKYESLSIHIERLRSKRPLVRADELMKQGLSGPPIGKALQRIENHVINNNIQTKEEALKWWNEEHPLH